MLAALKTLAEQDLSIDEQIAIFQEINGMPITGEALAQAVRYFYGTLLNQPQPANALDIVGTGGDGQDTFNISTTTALYLAYKGIPIIKNGSIAVSSRSGSVECLQALGIACAANFDIARQEFSERGYTFLFVRDFYLVWAKFREARLKMRASGEKTIANLIGPLLNPFNPRYQILGVYDQKLLQPMAEAMQLLGRQGFVVTSEGTDELTLSPDHHILEVRPHSIKRKVLDLPALGFAYAPITELKGGDPTENAAIARGIIDGSLQGPKRDVVLLNALLGEMAYGA